MGQSDLPIARTKSGKINAKWYYDRLKSSPSKSRINIRRGKQILSSPIQINSARSLNSNPHVKENSSIDRSSSSIHLISRPPSTPVQRRCERIHSSIKTPIEKETCQLLGPQLCADCIEIETRSNLSYEHLPNNLVQQRLTSLAIRKFIPNQTLLNDNQLVQIINNQRKKSNNSNSILTDQEYFDQLSSSLNHYANQTPFYFTDFKDLTEKYQSNKYPRLFLSETPAPVSSNPVFKESSFEKFDISEKYSSMKRASTAKPNLTTNARVFISPRKSELFYQQHRFLTNSSPPLLSQRLISHSNHFIQPSNPNKTFKHSLINHRSSNQ